VFDCPEPERADLSSRSCARWPELIQDARDLVIAVDLVQDGADRQAAPGGRFELWQSWFDTILYQVLDLPGTRRGK
jgi:hypothetical protein